MEDRAVPAVITGAAWYDSNLNDTFDPGEQPAAGVNATLIQDGVTLDTAQTNADGQYAFTGLASGSYSVQFDVPSGYSVPSQAGMGYTAVYVGTDDVGVGAGLVASGSGSGSGAASDSGSGSGSGTGMGGSGSGSGWSSGSGSGSGVGADPGAGSSSGTGSGSGSGLGDAGSGSGSGSQVGSGSGSGVGTGSAIIDGQVEIAPADPAETPTVGLAGAMVSLTTDTDAGVTDTSGNPVGPVTTDTTGSFAFPNLPAGTYHVAVVAPDGYTILASGVRTWLGTVAAGVGRSQPSRSSSSRLLPSPRPRRRRWTESSGSPNSSSGRSRRTRPRPTWSIRFIGGIRSNFRGTWSPPRP